MRRIHRYSSCISHRRSAGPRRLRQHHTRTDCRSAARARISRPLESTEYEALLQLSQRKTPIIAGGDLAELQKITDEEQELVSRIHNLDKQRAGVTADIADVLNRDVNDLKLPNLITMLSARPAEQQALADSHDRLQAAVRGLKRVNEQNSELLNSALEMVEFEMNLLQASKAAPETANYNRGAYNAGDTMGVIDHGFDAKQ